VRVAGIVESFKQGYEGRDSGRFRVGGVMVRCSHCGGEEFDTGSALLNTRGRTLLGIDFTDRGANLLICTQCTHVEWFVDEPEGL
jgi:hypothetical protein